MMKKNNSKDVEEIKSVRYDNVSQSYRRVQWISMRTEKHDFYPSFRK